ncbi:MAG: efflux RND transporter permease subunit [Bacteroidetes bacterium]|nr:efflux RND transporter permease subunit [Bacteroidota bacterium]
MNITALSIKRPTLIVVIFTVLTFLGIVSYYRLNYELLPKYSQPVLFVGTAYPGASPTEVENSVTKKIEDAVSSLEEIDNIQSTSFEGYSAIVIIFRTSADMDKATRDCQQKVYNVQSALPKDALAPVMSNFSMSDIPIMRLGVTAKISSTELYDLVKQKISPMLSRVKGVSQINLMGGEEREIRVNISSEKLDAYGISLLQVTQAIQASNMEFPTGKIKDKNQQYIIRLSGKFSQVGQLRNLVVATTAGGSVVKLGDIAEIQDAAKEIANISRYNGLNSIGVFIFKQPDGNEVKISEEIKKEIANIESIYKDKELKFAIANDTSDFTLASANAVMHDLLLAVFLVAIVMLVFMHSLRNSFIVMVAIPASLISTFIAMYVMDFSLNIISLVAMSLVIGILVDDSIVVLENIYRHLEMGKERRKAALDGRNEINYTALSITLVDVVVFLPIALSSSMISGMLRQFSLVVVFSTLLSLFVSFTLTPLLASRIAKFEHYRSKSLLGRWISMFEKGFNRLRLSYSHLLVWTLRHKAIVLIAATVLLISSFALVGGGFIGSEFVSMGDRGELIINLELPKDASIQQTNQVTLRAESILLAKPEVVSVFAAVGFANSFDGTGNTAYQSELHIRMVDKKKRNITAEKFSRELKKELTATLTGVKVRSSIISLVGTSDLAPIQMVLTGPNVDTLVKYAEQLKNVMKTVPGTDEVKLSVEPGNPEVNIKLDKEKMARMGLSMAEVGASLQNAFSGNTDSKFRQLDNEYDINVLLDSYDRRKIENVINLPFVNHSGQTIRLGQFADISSSTGTSMLQRYNRMSSVTVSSQALGRPVGSVGEDISKKIKNIKFPKEITLILEGDLKYQNEAFGSLFLAFLISILFVYLIMVALYDSYLYPLVVLLCIPLAIVGALFGLALTMESLTIFSILGMIMLVGLVGKNAILLVDFTNQMRAEGYAVPRALVMAGKVRLRPIMMTTLSMIASMLPIALAQGAGSEWKNGIAWALIGGLTSSLILTLVLVPAVYLIFDNMKQRTARFFLRFKRRKAIVMSSASA